MITATQEKYLDPYTDFGFKKLFGTEANKELLMDFLNQLITEQGVITDIQYLPSEQLGRNEFDRRAIFDIHCQTDKGVSFIVEMQKAKQNYFKDRSIFYSTYPIQQQAQAGNWDYKLHAVYFVGILDFVFDEDKNDSEVFHHDVKLIDTATNKVFYDKLTYIYLEMPKFNKTESELNTRFDKWLYVLKSLPKFQAKPEILKEQVFNKLFHIAELANFSPSECISYEASLKAYRDNFAVMKTALEEAKSEGLAEGLAEGEAKGEKKKEESIVLKMWSKLQSVDEIHTFTDIPVATIIEILKRNGINP